VRERRSEGGIGQKARKGDEMGCRGGEKFNTDKYRNEGI
jgi:hypothetical protein